MALLKKANQLFRKQKYQEALNVYQAVLVESPELYKYIVFNIAMAKKKVEIKKLSSNLKLYKKSLSAKTREEINTSPINSLSSEAIEYYEKAHPAAAYVTNCQLYTVDIIVPVYNALEDVKNCLHSLEINTDSFRVNAIIVNDKSDEDTSEWLRDFCAESSLFTLIEHSENCGYTKAINTGLSYSQADYIVTLNSDTIVTKGWLQGLVRCIRSNKKLGIVGPLSNAASWQNVPDLLDENKQFAVNDIPLEMTPDEMAELVRDASHNVYPRVPFVNGFCFMMSRNLVEAVGLLDEEAFPTGYGEENDYCIRAADAGFELAIADDAYVYHAKSKSFGHQKRKQLSSKGSKKLKEKHTEEKVSRLISKIKNTKHMDSVRASINLELENSTAVRKDKLKVEGVALKQSNINILFLLPVQGGGGGAHSVVQEAYAMRRLGINVNVAMKHTQLPKFLQDYSDVPDSKDIFVGFSDDSLINLSESYDVVIATLFSSVRYLKKIVDINPHILPAYYIQDYEPLFFEEGTERWNEAYRSYKLIPNVFAFAKTHWIIDKVRDCHGLEVEKVSPSIDHSVYKIRSGKVNKKIIISAMIRPKTPRRGAARTMRVLSEIYKNNSSDIEVKIFGCESDEIGFKELESDFEFVNYGVLKRAQVAEILNSSDIFVDLSDYQAFGRTGLEAMACGAVAVLPIFGGAHEYAVHYSNALLVDPFDESSCFKEISALIRSKKVLHEMQNKAALTAANYSAHKAAVSELVPLVSRLAELREHAPKINKKRLLIFPSLQKDRITPTGSGYVRLLLPYQAPQVLKWNHVETVKSLPDPNDYDDCTIIMQRDVSTARLSDIKLWVEKWKAKGNKLIYDLDDDLLEFENFKNKGKFGADIPEKIRFLIRTADLVTVSTDSLKEKLSPFSRKEIRVVENVIDKDVWGLENERGHSLSGSNMSSERAVTIGYIGTASHIYDVKIVEDALSKIKNKYGDKVKVEVIGVFQDVIPTFGERVGLPKKRDYPNFVDWLKKRAHWDIGVIPLENNEFNKSKSYLKFLEYAALNMAIVVSDHQAYAKIARHGENCLVAVSSMDHWVKNISKLIDDKLLREKLARNSLHECRERFVLDENYTLTSDVLKQVGTLGTV